MSAARRGFSGKWGKRPVLTANEVQRCRPGEGRITGKVKAFEGGGG